MPERLLKATLYPQTLFWVPLPIAAINFSSWMLLMMIGMGAFRLNPLPFVVAMFITHIALAARTQKEPHMATLLQARAKMPGPTRNIVRSKGKKYTP